MKRVNLDYQLFLQREEQFQHYPYEDEMQFYKAVQRGDIAFLEEHKKRDAKQKKKRSATEGRGILSRDPVRNERYHLIVNASMITRKCIEYGLMQEIAFTLSDLYIRMADEAKTVKDIEEINDEMVKEFTLKMHELRFQHIVSSHVSRCIVYIYDHLHEQITIEQLGKIVELTPTYLAFLFKKETGTTIHKFILDKRLETAENLLKQSDYSYLEIANTLRFSSQSHFIKLFKGKYGLTPKEYRMQNHYRYVQK